MLNSRYLVVLALAGASIVTGCTEKPNDQVDFHLSSLTGSDFTNKKYYMGWGDYLDGEMGNETKYDVKHTNDVFTSGAGGTYASTTITGRDFNGDDVIQAISKIRGQMQQGDMYVQYSSGHGYNGGLGIGLDYSQIWDQVSKMPAREVIIFTMACFSGSEVDLVNQHKSEWANWASQGKTLFVMSSSTAEEESSTGPGTDPHENGPDGSAGSAYGHALWRALAGDADGYLDGVKDGFVSLGEIIAFATDLTQQIGGHTPTVTGNYNAFTIMNKVPSGTWTAARPDGTEGMTQDQIRQAMNKSDQLMTGQTTQDGGDQ